ncbi:hypothetical protein [Pseudomonas aeruginosa]|uniref:hypothetical protein n=1 Tax=Pseudomonas aeruginosa TaxID=287 RepID=UPI00190F600B|nr:hypothetical protein [Pseudomonas aeruginosa]
MEQQGFHRFGPGYQAMDDVHQATRRLAFQHPRALGTVAGLQAQFALDAAGFRGADWLRPGGRGWVGTHARGWGEGPSGVLRLSVFFLSQAGFHLRGDAFSSLADEPHGYPLGQPDAVLRLVE